MPEAIQRPCPKCLKSTIPQPGGGIHTGFGGFADPITKLGRSFGGAVADLVGRITHRVRDSAREASPARRRLVDLTATDHDLAAVLGATITPVQSRIYRSI